MNLDRACHTKTNRKNKKQFNLRLTCSVTLFSFGAITFKSRESSMDQLDEQDSFFPIAWLMVKSTKKGKDLWKDELYNRSKTLQEHAKRYH